MKKSYNTIGSIGFVFMLSFVCGNINAQTKTVTGKVTMGNRPLSGASVSQQGSDQTAVINTQGIYQLQITGENPVLIFRHPDYPEQRIEVNSRTRINVSFTEKVKGIEEVVLNAGYYKVKERESTGSIAKVSAKDIENQPVTNVLSTVQGRMAGVNITQNSGVPGGGYDIQIRGRNSLRSAGNEALYIIDGVPYGGRVNAQNSAGILPSGNISPLNGINPNDIESIEILKDADATAIYGTRGANGVILVTTKRGVKGKTQVSLNTSYGLTKVARHLEMMNTEEYLDMRRQSYANSGIAVYPANAYDVNGKWDSSRYTDWQKVLIGNWAEQQSTLMSINAGSENSTFLISGGHTENTTVFPGDFRYKVNTLMSSYSYRSPDKKLSLSSSANFSTSDNNVVNADLTNRSLFLSPNAPALYNQDGSLNWADGTFSSPVAALEGKYSNKTTQFNQSMNLEYKLGYGFAFKVNGGLNFQDFEEFSVKPNTMYNPTSASGSSSQYSTSSKGNNRIFSFIAEPQLAWNKKIGKHQLEALLGGSLQQIRNKQSGITGTGFSSNALLYNVTAANTKTFRDEIDTDYRYASLYGRLNYKFNGRYILNFTTRRDGSSRFGTDNRFASFGALGAAWLFSEESFLKEVEWLSIGKLRGSYGITGSDAIGDYQYLDTYSISTMSYNDVVGYYPSRLYNPLFSWEKTKKLEMALQLGFWKDRVNFQAAWYRNRSSNQLVGIPLSATTGFSSVQANLDATVENSGWELELSVKPIKTKEWGWNSSFNITVPKNKLLSFPGLEGSTYANTYVVGYPTSIVKLYQYEGIDPGTGLYVFKDFNGDGKITSPDDNKAIENLGTRFFGGWQNDFNYKNISLSFLFQFVKQISYNYFNTMPYPGNMNNLPAAFTNVWSPSNPSGIIMPYSVGNNAQVNALNANFAASTAAIGDASYIRLKNVQLNYRIPIHSKTAKEAVIYFQGQNLLTWTNYFGLDPEFTSAGYLPPLKTYSIGCQITF
ncbi:SusC/RagA family TonB-linked outer membrane protein [Chryseobacterium sp. ISL-6]|uniref:SusC/RagA family TonB-linked outer membrane protein n=1 Tax=Chryseobacterium sp. ISL-6 TaxID=2819143 RepID=UPI001BE97A50|nr:SusC/RagA family TonB-linked outer membrane protein [Chryseobacterium sp. ISL-6]MBT2623675.1 SusC/RagA family TonB-linked outer membrane protein [Chryseobacterium sp. ISL-6]